MKKSNTQGTERKGEMLDRTLKPEQIDWEYQITYQRGIEAVNWAVPAVSMLSMRKG